MADPLVSVLRWSFALQTHRYLLSEICLKVATKPLVPRQGPQSAHIPHKGSTMQWSTQLWEGSNCSPEEQTGPPELCCMQHTTALTSLCGLSIQPYTVCDLWTLYSTWLLFCLAIWWFLPIKGSLTEQQDYWAILSVFISRSENSWQTSVLWEDTGKGRWEEGKRSHWYEWGVQEDQRGSQQHMTATRWCTQLNYKGEIYPAVLSSCSTTACHELWSGQNTQRDPMPLVRGQNSRTLVYVIFYSWK